MEGLICYQLLQSIVLLYNGIPLGIAAGVSNHEESGLPFGPYRCFGG